jgi:hypothetical protein
MFMPDSGQLKYSIPRNFKERLVRIIRNPARHGIGFIRLDRNSLEWRNTGSTLAES